MGLDRDPSQVVLADLPLQFWRGVMRTLDESLQAEGIEDPVRDRIINRVVYGHPDGSAAYARALRQERDERWPSLARTPARTRD
jgi:hypothetical protein